MVIHSLNTNNFSFDGAEVREMVYGKKIKRDIIAVKVARSPLYWNTVLCTEIQCTCAGDVRSVS